MLTARSGQLESNVSDGQSAKSGQPFQNAFATTGERKMHYPY